MEPDYDVFLSYTADDATLARRVQRELNAAELRVFNAASVAAGEPFQASLWNALAESAALVVVTSGAVKGANILAEIGACAAWQKPMYVLASDVKHVELGLRTHHLHVHPLTKLNRVIEALREASRPMSARERLLLAQIYTRLGIATDELTRRPMALDGLTEEFNRVSGKNMSGTMLLRELLRLRKRGRLPVLKQGRRSEGKSVHVVRRGDGWAVKRAGATRAISVHPTQRAAVEAARERAITRSSDVVIHSRDGKILHRDSYGNDPLPPRDRKH